MVELIERPPASVGIDPAGLDRVVQLIAERGAAAQVCLFKDGHVVLDRVFGCRSDSLFWIFSASKPYVAMAVHLLAQRGALTLDDPVSRYWPEFGQRGKDAITVRHVLRHRAGLPVAHSVIGDGAAMTNWRRAVRLIERATPVSPPGGAPSYHLLSYGFILGELVARVTGVAVRDFVATEILAPLGLTDTHLGLDAAQLARSTPIRATGRGRRIKELAFNRRRVRMAVIPAAGISTTARELARFYQSLLDADRGANAVFTAATVAEARRPSSNDELDQRLGTRVRWAQGFQLGGPTAAGTGPGRAMGRLSSTLTFGHNGSKCCIGWADPTRQLAFAYVTDLLPGAGGHVYQRDVADALLAACG
jgi:CubicO group peptidase (beta-lactamase class C family)